MATYYRCWIDLPRDWAVTLMAAVTEGANITRANLVTALDGIAVGYTAGDKGSPGGQIMRLRETINADVDAGNYQLVNWDNDTTLMRPPDTDFVRIIIRSTDYATILNLTNVLASPAGRCAAQAMGIQTT